MNKEELKEYLKDNLKLNISYEVGLSKIIELKLEDEVISKIKLGVF